MPSLPTLDAWIANLGACLQVAEFGLDVRLFDSNTQNECLFGHLHDDKSPLL